jgi:hypothetical protein
VIDVIRGYAASENAIVLLSKNPRIVFISSDEQRGVMRSQIALSYTGVCATFLPAGERAVLAEEDEWLYLITLSHEVDLVMVQKSLKLDTGVSSVNIEPSLRIFVGLDDGQVLIGKLDIETCTM